MFDVTSTTITLVNGNGTFTESTVDHASTLLTGEQGAAQSKGTSAGISLGPTNNNITFSAAAPGTIVSLANHIRPTTTREGNETGGTTLLAPDNMTITLGPNTSGLLVRARNSQTPSSLGQNSLIVKVPSTVIIGPAGRQEVRSTSVTVAQSQSSGVALTLPNNVVISARPLYAGEGAPPLVPNLTLRVTGTRGQTLDVPITQNNEYLFANQETLQRELESAIRRVETLPLPGNSMTLPQAPTPSGRGR